MKSISKVLVPVWLSSVSMVGVAESPPGWWEEDGVTNEEDASHRSPVVAGQLKWMATKAWENLHENLPGGAGFALSSVIAPVPSSPGPEWYEAQRTVVNLGQLKHVAEPFYRRLQVAAPGWLAEEFERNGLESWAHAFPWDPSAPSAENYPPAVLGQLKLVFSLRFAEDFDDDDLPDLLEHFFYGSTSGDGTTTDYDQDGLSDADEIFGGTRPDLADTDGDGIPDGIDPNPLTPASTAPAAASGLHVWAPGN